ncbi:hypothetical protein CPLU01_14756 [Colletotrichum plurivorum]|uniref:Uncharacterized protein n=1 Tax=Colletotrichum plurivorum TaxID=2175906 RepID=A0A8H6MYM9_9PEZI|nr:hypothetical protein CPLU01_14756 [Colletotrichum plurivorum]
MAKKKKTLKTATEEQHMLSASGEALDVRPAVSPYTSPSCKIYFKTGQPFTVPRDLIRMNVELDKVCSDSDEIHITDLPDEAGHILVHYLYTGTW